jgi:hypothetical protein
VGRVSDLKECPERSEKFYPPLCCFRIERPGPSPSGIGFSRLAVEMFGFPLDGTVVEGDWIEVIGDRKRGWTVRAEEIIPLSTGERFRAVPEPRFEDDPKNARFLFVRRLVVLFLALVACGGVGALVWSAFGLRVFHGA